MVQEMRRTGRRMLAFVLVAAMFVGFIPGISRAESGDPELFMSVANKIDVALAVNKTNVNYATFEADLRAALKWKLRDDGMGPDSGGGSIIKGDGSVIPVTDDDTEAAYRTNVNKPESDAPYPVPDEDLYILAAETVNTNVTKEFNWWVYDHTRSSSIYTGASAGKAIVDDVNRIYVQNDEGQTVAASSSYGTIQDTDPTGVYPLTGTTKYSTYTPSKLDYVENPADATDLMKNPDVGTAKHNYEGNYRHMISSNNGAQMDFYGYSRNGYKDLRYLPNTQTTIKTFEFAIAEDQAYDALDGVGFFLNLEITEDTYENQKMTGYLLFLQYSSTGVGQGMSLYKLQNVSVKAFHENTATMFNNNASPTAVAGFTRVATAAYPGTDFSRRIKIEAAPDKITVWYVGSTVKNHAATLNTPINERDASGAIIGTETQPVNWTIQSGQGTGQADTVQFLNLDSDYVKSYGYGPMSAYRDHSCARPTHLALLNLSMTVERVKSLTEVVRMPEWHENTMKFLVNLNENEIEDFKPENNAIVGELLSRLTNDDIYYMGWGNSINAVASAEFLLKNNLKGIVITMETLAQLYATNEWKDLSSEKQNAFKEYIKEAQDSDAKKAYWKQIYTLADSIYARYCQTGDSEYALVTDNVTMGLDDPERMNNTITPEYPNGQWMIQHKPTENAIAIVPAGSFGGPGGTISGPIYMTNFTGTWPDSGQTMSDLATSYNFPYPGKYEIIYRDRINDPLGTLLVHRAPVAQFEVYRDGSGDDKVSFTSTSYDPDVYVAGGTGPNGTYKGIVKEEWTILDLDDDGTAYPLDASEAYKMTAGHTYVVTLTVTDDWGAETSVSKNVFYAGEEEGGDVVVRPPIAEFVLTPGQIIQSSDPAEQQNQKITITDSSYDPGGYKLEYIWTIMKNDEPFAALIIDSNYDEAKTREYVVGNLGPGTYKVQLVVKNIVKDKDDKDIGKESGAVSQTFKIVFDGTAPSAAILPVNKNATEPTEPSDANADFKGNGTLTLSFADAAADHKQMDELPSGFKEARFAVTKTSTAPSSANPGGGTDMAGVWKAVTTSTTRSVLLDTVGISYIHWEAWDKAGNFGSGTFGPYLVVKTDVDMVLTVVPVAEGTIYFGDPELDRVTLTATLDENDFLTSGEEPDITTIIPTGTVSFYQFDEAADGWVYLGVGTVNAGGVATYTGPVKGTSQRFEARYSGDGIYSDTKAEIMYDDAIENAPMVEITIIGKRNDTDGGVLFSFTKSVPKKDDVRTVVLDSELIAPQPWVLKAGESDKKRFAPDDNSGDGKMTVEFYYESPETTVKVRLVLEGTDPERLVPGTMETLVAAQVDTQMTIPAPSITGYNHVSTNPAGGTISPTGTNDVVTFYYTAATGNLTVIALDGDNGGAEIGRITRTVSTGAVDTTDANAPTAAEIPNLSYYELVADSGDSTTLEYDGVTDVTLSYTYTKKTSGLTLIACDAQGNPLMDGGGEIIFTISSLKVLENYNYSGDIAALTALVQAVYADHEALTPSNPSVQIAPTAADNTVKVLYTDEAPPVVPGYSVPVQYRGTKLGVTYNAADPATYTVLGTSFVTVATQNAWATVSESLLPTFGGYTYDRTRSTLSVLEGSGNSIIVVYTNNMLKIEVYTQKPSGGEVPFTTYSVEPNGNQSIPVPEIGGYVLDYYIVGTTNIGEALDNALLEKVVLENVTADGKVTFVYQAYEDYCDEWYTDITVTGMAGTQKLYSGTYQVYKGTGKAYDPDIPGFPYPLTYGPADAGHQVFELQNYNLVLPEGEDEFITMVLTLDDVMLHSSYIFHYTRDHEGTTTSTAQVWVSVYDENDADLETPLLRYPVTVDVGERVTVDPTILHIAGYEPSAGNAGAPLFTIAVEPTGADGENEIIVYMTPNTDEPTPFAEAVTITVKMVVHGTNPVEELAVFEIQGISSAATNYSHPAPSLPGYILVDGAGDDIPIFPLISFINPSNGDREIIFYYRAEPVDPTQGKLAVIYKERGTDNILGGAVVEFHAPTSIVISAPNTLFDIYEWDSDNVSVTWDGTGFTYTETEEPLTELVFYYVRKTVPLTLVAIDIGTNTEITTFDTDLQRVLEYYNYDGDVTGLVNSLTALVQGEDSRYQLATALGDTNYFVRIEGNTLTIYYYMDQDPTMWEVTFQAGQNGRMNPRNLTVSVEDGESLNDWSVRVPAINPYSGYSFTGWLCSTDGRVYTSAQVAAMVITEDTVFTAQYKKDSTSNPGTNPPLDLNPSDPTKPTNPTKPTDPTEPKDPDGSTGTKPIIDVEKVFSKDHYAYIMGYTDGTVRPTANIVREEVAVILFRLLADDVRRDYWAEANSFSDVADDRWSNTEISTMANLGVLAGYTDGTFKPSQSITRAEFVALITRFFDFEATAGASPFSDIEGSWAKDAILKAYELGIVSGYTDGTFNPDGYITRAEAMKILNLLTGRCEPDSTADLDSDMKTWVDNMDETVWHYYHVQEATNSHYYEKTDERWKWTGIRPSRDWTALTKNS